MLSNIEAETGAFFSDFGLTIALPTITHVKEKATEAAAVVGATAEDNEDANKHDKLN